MGWVHKYRGDVPYEHHRRACKLYYAASHRARRQGLAFDLTSQYILDQFPKGCARTGIKFDLEKNGYNYGNRSPWCPSIDKIDPRGGYTKDNIQIVCWWYNAAKAQFTDAEVLDLCRKLVSFSDMQNAEIVVAQTP